MENYSKQDAEMIISDQDFQQLIMSRLNWMTYLKVLFDKLTIGTQSNAVNIFQLLEALKSIQSLLPLQIREDYYSKKGQDKGLTVFEVENIIKMAIIDKKQMGLISWDDVIDMFLSGKISVFNSLNDPISIQENSNQDDLVNVSGDDNTDENITSNKSRVFEKRALSIELSVHSNANSNISNVNQSNLLQNYSPKFSPYWETKNYGAQQLQQDVPSPPEQLIAKKIVFSDISMNKENRNSLNQKKTSDHQKSDSKGTGGNHHCSFYLTPSSVMQTPTQLKGMNLQNFANEQEDDSKSKEESIRLRQRDYNTKSVFNYQTPFESFFNSQQFKKRTHNDIIQISEMSNSKDYFYDIVYSNRKACSSMQVVQQKEQGQKNRCLRGLNLSKNMFSRIYLLHPIQSQQLLILNMSHNLIQSLSGIEHCINLQFINLSYNMILDIGILLELKNIQEIYFSHNLITSFGLSNNGCHQICTAWPQLQIMDFNDNKLMNYDEVSHLMTGNYVSREIFKIITVKGNQFYNIEESVIHDQINTELETYELIDQYSLFNCVPALSMICFNTSESQQSISVNKSSDLTQGKHQSSIISSDPRSSLQLYFKHNAQQKLPIELIQRVSKTRLEKRKVVNTSRASSNLIIASSRSVSRELRPKTQLNAQGMTSFSLKNRSSSQNQKPLYKENSTQRKEELNKAGLQQVTKPLTKVKENKKINLVKVEKPLSRNVRFFNLSLNKSGIQKENLKKIGMRSSDNKSYLSLTNSIQQSSMQDQKKISLNNQLKKSIDLTLGVPSCLTKSSNPPNTTKHNSSYSFSFTSQLSKMANSKSSIKTQNDTLKTSSIIGRQLSKNSKTQMNKNAQKQVSILSQQIKSMGKKQQQCEQSQKQTKSVSNKINMYKH